MSYLVETEAANKTHFTLSLYIGESQPGTESDNFTSYHTQTEKIQKSGTGTCGQADSVEEVGLDPTLPQEASIQHHTPSPDLEPAGEERPASQQLEARH